MRTQSMIQKCVWLSALAVSLVSVTANAERRLDFPADFPGPPYYARITQQFVVHTDKWAAIVFYRQPSCVPPTFNLLNLFDPPAAFACALTFEGFALYDQNPPQINLPPREEQGFGLGAVPVAFVSWPELQSAITDGFSQLGNSQSCHRYAWALRRSFTRLCVRRRFPAWGGSEHPKLTMVARGNGFILEVRARGNPLTLDGVTIKFR